MPVAWTRLELSELVAFVEFTKERQIKEPVWWFQQTLQYIQQCLFEWDMKKVEEISEALDRERGSQYCIIMHVWHSVQGVLEPRALLD